MFPVDFIICMLSSVLFIFVRKDSLADNQSTHSHLSWEKSPLNLNWKLKPVTCRWASGTGHTKLTCLSDSQQGQTAVGCVVSVPLAILMFLLTAKSSRKYAKWHVCNSTVWCRWFSCCCGVAKWVLSKLWHTLKTDAKQYIIYYTAVSVWLEFCRRHETSASLDLKFGKAVHFWRTLCLYEHLLTPHPTRLKYVAGHCKLHL